MITVARLTKRCGSRVAVPKVSLSCAQGTRAGLTLPDRDVSIPGRVMGVMLDPAAVPAGRTGQETLRITAQILGQPAPKAKLLLGQVGLADAALKQVSHYPLGRRQGLRIAVALLGQLTALILAEPADGHDPGVIR